MFPFLQLLSLENLEMYPKQTAKSIARRARTFHSPTTL